VASRRVVPLSGIVFVVLALLVVAVIGGNTPGAGASGPKVSSYYDAHSTREGIAAFVLAASVPFLVLFGIYFASALQAATATRQSSTYALMWERLLVAGTAVAGAAVLVGALIHFALADSGDRGVAGEAIRTLNILDQNSWIAWNSGLGLMMLGAGTTALSHAAVLPRWLAWLAVAVGILLFVPFVDFFALLLTLIWIIATSILLYRAQKPEIAEVATLPA
jgi:hypothetical protein